MITGLFISGFCTEVWQFYVATGFTLFEIGKYGVTRSLLTKCVSQDETGKVYGPLAIMGAVIPMIGNVAHRKLYNNTLETFPAAEIMLTACILLLASVLNFVIYTQKWRIDLYNSQNNESKTTPTH